MQSGISYCFCYFAYYIQSLSLLAILQIAPVGLPLNRLQTIILMFVLTVRRLLLPLAILLVGLLARIMLALVMVACGILIGITIQVPINGILLLFVSLLSLLPLTHATAKNKPRFPNAVLLTMSNAMNPATVPA
jgi:hypothetical protein